MRHLPSVLSLLALLAAACNTPPKDPPRDGADGPATASERDASKAPVATATAAPAPTTAPATATATGAASAATTTASPTPKADASAPAGKACAADADCRTFSSYCAEAPCACRVLAKADGDPKCLGSGTKVSCFVDPCKNKGARCESGACVLTAKGAAGATER